MFVGVFFPYALQTEVKYEKKSEYEYLSTYWPSVCRLKDNNGNVINLGDLETISMLASDEKKQNEYVIKIVDQVLEYINSEEASLEECLLRI